MRPTSKLVPHVTYEMIENIPGVLNDRRTMLGELNWIFTAITGNLLRIQLEPNNFYFFNFIFRYNCVEYFTSWAFSNFIQTRPSRCKFVQKLFACWSHLAIVWLHTHFIASLTSDFSKWFLGCLGPRIRRCIVTVTRYSCQQETLHKLAVFRRATHCLSGLARRKSRAGQSTWATSNRSASSSLAST